MKYICNKVLVYVLLIISGMVFGVGAFAHQAAAQYYYPNTGVSNSSQYTYYRQLCPADFMLKAFDNNQYMCFKFLGNTVNVGYYDTSYNNFPNYNPVTSIPNVIPGCLPGYMYSQLTGQRCDGTNYNNNTLQAGYGEIRNFEMRDGSDSNPEEGEDNAEIAKARFDVRNGDVRLDKVTFNFEFTGSSNGEDLPWNTFDNVRLMLNGREIDNMNTDDVSDWDEEDSDTYSLVFSGLDDVIRDNERADITLEVDINPSISGAGSNDVSWDIYIPDNGLKARNGNGNTIYEGDDSESVSIDIEEN